MLLNLFTREFRKRLGARVRTASGRESRVLAAQISPVLSAFVVIGVLGQLPVSSTLAAAGVVLLGIGLGAIAAYALPHPVLLLMRALTVDFADVHVRLSPKKPSEGTGHNDS
jgi:hypothetical protein